MVKRTKRRFYGDKPILGSVEEANIWDGDKKKHKVLARIDTGADFSSISEKLAKKIGFRSIVEEMKKIVRIIKHPIKNSKPERKMLQNIRGVTNSVLIRSASGRTRRPMVPVKIKLADIIIKTEVTIIERTNMNYEMIIGREDLRKGAFVIDPKRRR